MSFNPLRPIAAIYRATIVAGVNRSRVRRGVGELDRTGRRQLVGVTIVCAVMLSAFVISGPESAPTSRSTATAAAPSTTIPALPTTAPTAVPASTGDGVTEHAPVDGEHVRVATVTDGDTFQITDGRKVRLLGIDSCEDHAPDKTPGGADATEEAESLFALSNYEVTLVAQPDAPDKDRHGRLLRHAILADGSDFGVSMVGWDHTGIYQGNDNDASPAYLDELYAHDLDHAANPPSGRECGQFPPPPPPVSHDDDTYVPLPDNDDDGESWFCRKRRWC